MIPERRAPEYLNTKQLAQRLGLHFHTLEKWRVEGKGPPFIRIGRTIKYRWWEVEKWMNERQFKNTSQY